MISLILPYWDRQEAAAKAIDLIAKHYSDLDLEIVFVDDGNSIPFCFPESSENLYINYVKLPKKDYPTPQSRAWNMGVYHAHGDIVILSCAEILHETPVIEQLIKELQSIGKDGYVLASAWCPEDKAWHCHSSRIVPTCPEGTGQTYLAAMYKELFNRAGGFDMDYMNGAGYEDRDFIWRMHSVGAKFRIMDNLKVIHPKSGASIKWKQEGFAMNEEIYYKKWPQAKHKHINFVCLKAGDAYGPEYVNILRDMVARNLPYGFPGKFICITDNPEGLDSEIQVIPLPDDLETWYGKLYMFKRGLFHDGDRMIFMDLDTLVTGPLDDIVKYDGEFATLRDFYHSDRVGPAVIMWKAGGMASTIWDEWESSGKPRNPLGDLWWINNLDQGRFVKKIDILQDIYPNKFVSFKANCNPYPPAKTSIVCFHGQPKPDNCMVDWVEDIWKIGGGGMAELEAVSNTSFHTIEKHVKSACERDIPWLEVKSPHEKQAVIVSGGPSIEKTFKEILWRYSLGQIIIAVNGSAKWLNEKGIIPDIHIIIDAREDNVRFITESQAKERYLASQCHPALFDSAENTTLFHMNTDGIANFIPENRKANLISSGTTVGLAAMAVAYCLGYRAIHLHGFDSSYEDKHHAYPQAQNDNDSVVDVMVEGRSFKAAPWMVLQAQQFQELAKLLADSGVIITVAGDGLLPYIAHCMA